MKKTMFGIILSDNSVEGVCHGTYVCLKLFKTNKEAINYVPSFVEITEEQHGDNLVNELPYDVQVIEYEIT